MVWFPSGPCQGKTGKSGSAHQDSALSQEHPHASGAIQRPQGRLSRKAAEPILYLADRVTQLDNEAVARDSRMVDALADALGLPTFRRQPWFRDMTEAGALHRITSDNAKRAALVVLSLMIKTGRSHNDAALEYFSRVRRQLGADPVRVPQDVEQHKRLALRYFKV
jgi:hypothetical protein